MKVVQMKAIHSAASKYSRGHVHDTPAVDH
jgi:hypothetical protein